ncbi:MAG: hypothetical protein ABJN22_11570 [Litorimonas sp.]
MPRITHKFPKPSSKTLSTHEELRNLSLAVTIREKQVKLRRLEWDTQRIALPHITPMPGDGELQIRKPMTKGDIPTPRPPSKPPAYHPEMDSDLYGIMMKVYLDGLQDEWDRNPYNKLASISAQEKRDARR